MVMMKRCHIEISSKEAGRSKAKLALLHWGLGIRLGRGRSMGRGTGRGRARLVIRASHL